MKIFAGNSHPELFHPIARHLEIQLGMMSVSSFADGEVNVEVTESVRGVDAVVLQSTCPPVNENIMEVMAIIDALRRASVRSVTLVVPYFGYARQDRRLGSARVPIMAKVVAGMLATVNIDRVLMMDAHSEVMQGFFSMPVDNIYATPVFIEDILKHDLSGIKVVSPDVGGVVRARRLAKSLGGVDLAIIDKRRDPIKGTQSLQTIGDVNDCHCIVVDDLLDTGGTLMQAAKALKSSGAASVRAYITHPVCSTLTFDEVMGSDIDDIVLCNTIPLKHDLKECSKVRTICVAPLISEAIHRVFYNQSLEGLLV